MTDHKELGAKQMLDQSVVYLYNSYRENGMTKEQASKRVTIDMENVYEKYASMSVMTDSLRISSPTARIDNLIEELNATDYKQWRSLGSLEQNKKVEALIKSLVIKMKMIKSILQ